MNRRSRKWVSAGIFTGELLFALLFLALSLFLNYWAGKHVDEVAAGLPPVGDFFLDRLPIVDLGVLFVWGFIVFLVLALGASLLYEGSRGPYIVWTFAVLVAVRSFFLILTPLGIPQDYIGIEISSLHYNIGGYLTFRNDLFFSAHTALPFLGYLIFSRKWVRYAFLGLSVVMAATVLLSRLHYSIDVASAYFITYGVYRFTGGIFNKWYEPWKRNLCTANWDELF